MTQPTLTPEQQAAFDAWYGAALNALQYLSIRENARTAFTAGWLAHAVASPVELEREAVARIIDPKAWTLLDKEIATPTKSHKNREPWSWLDYYKRGRASSLAKAEAIIALAGPHAGEQP